MVTRKQLNELLEGKDIDSLMENIDKFLGEDVMNYNIDRNHVYWVNQNGYAIYKIGDWSPTYHIAQAFLCLNKIKHNSMFITIDCYPSVGWTILIQAPEYVGRAGSKENLAECISKVICDYMINRKAVDIFGKEIDSGS